MPSMSGKQAAGDEPGSAALTWVRGLVNALVIDVRPGGFGRRWAAQFDPRSASASAAWPP